MPNVDRVVCLLWLIRGMCIDEDVIQYFHYSREQISSSQGKWGYALERAWVMPDTCQRLEGRLNGISGEGRSRD